MEEKNEISFLKKIKISIFGLENYEKLAIQTIGSVIGYIAKLMLIFVLILSIALTYKFSETIGNVKGYIESEISQINFENGTLTVTGKNETTDAIIAADEENLEHKIIIDTNEITEEQINNYRNEIQGYNTGIIILKDGAIINESGLSLSIPFSSIADRYNIVKLDKQNILDMLSGNNASMLYAGFFVIMYIYLFIIYFSTVLVDALLYSLIGYIAGMFSRLRLKYSAIYKISIHALTLPIILNLIYMLINIFTGFTIKYFDIMYLAITCIYIITAILMIKADMIKKQLELSRIISEQEKIKQEMERQEQEKREEEERERVRKEDEKKRQAEKKKEKEKKEKQEKKKSDKNDAPQPEANVVTRG